VVALVHIRVTVEKKKNKIYRTEQQIRVTDQLATVLVKSNKNADQDHVF
jgi:hypothetical protein